MTKWVEVSVRMYRRYMVEVPDDVAFPEQWADAEVYNCALDNKDQEALVEIETYLTDDVEYIERLKKESEVISLIKQGKKMDVIKYWDRIRAIANDPRTWEQLQPQEQYLIVNSLNCLFTVLQNYQG